jgi:integrase
MERSVYQQPNGKYAVCFMLEGKPRFRTVGYNLEVAREARQAFIEAARWGVVASAPQLRFAKVAGWWIERFARKVDVGERCERTLEIRRYHLEHHLLPAFGSWLVREISVQDVAELLDDLRARSLSENTTAGALATLSNIMRFAVRNSWIPESPIEKLEACERPRPARRQPRALGREEIARLLDGCLPRYRALIATALFTGMRVSELLGLTWRDVDLGSGLVYVRAQLSRRAPCRRVALKTRSAQRQIPISPQLRALLVVHRAACERKADADWVFATRNGTPLTQRNVMRSALAHAARRGGLLAGGARLRFHDLRHTFASHLIVDLGLDVLQVSRILGHSSASTTLDVYAHMFDEARHAADIPARMARSAFAGLLDRGGVGNVVLLPTVAAGSGRDLSVRERAAMRWSLDQNLTATVPVAPYAAVDAGESRPRAGDS